MRNSKFPENIKHPIFLPSSHPVTLLIIAHYHKLTKHQGRVITRSRISEEGFYILRATSVIKKYLHNCVICRKLRDKPQQQKMADLPLDRVDPSPPFTYCGLDVFGPFHNTEGQTRRTNSTKKLWAIVFICLVTKAIHIETLSQMDTNSFKLSLRRFFSIKGNCKKLRTIVVPTSSVPEIKTLTLRIFKLKLKNTSVNGDNIRLTQVITVVSGSGSFARFVR